MSEKIKPGDGDWICADAKCGNVNFSRRTECNKCGKAGTGTEERSEVVDLKKGGTEIGKVMAEKSKGLFSADDWQCKTCGNVNWARRMTCNMCNAPKFGKVEARTGYGGGYMERDEVVEYKSRVDSDSDEYDEFGRKKKKFRELSVPAKKPERIQTNDDDEDDDDDDDDDVDVSKYMLDSDEEEDDDDGDLDKYKLDDDDEEDDQSKNVNKLNKGNNERSRSKSRTSDSSSSSSSSSDSSRSRSRSRSRSKSGSSGRHRHSRSRSRSRDRQSRNHRQHRRSYSRSRSRSRSPTRRHHDGHRRRSRSRS